MTATTGKKSPLYFWFIFMIHWPAGMRSTINEAWDFMQFGHPAGDMLHLMLILSLLSSHSQESQSVKDTLKKKKKCIYFSLLWISLTTITLLLRVTAFNRALPCEIEYRATHCESKSVKSKEFCNSNYSVRF